MILGFGTTVIAVLPPPEAPHRARLSSDRRFRRLIFGANDESMDASFAVEVQSNLSVQPKTEYVWGTRKWSPISGANLGALAT